MKSILKVIAINLGLLIGGLVAIDLVFGSWIFGPDMNRLNIVRDREIHFDTTDLYDGGGPMVFRRDAFGLRGNYGTPADIDILTIGGSTTNQLFVPDGQTWQDVWQQADHDAGRTIRIANAGVDGQTTRGHIRNFDNWFADIEGLKPAYVLAYVGINDTVADAREDNPNDALEGLRTFKHHLRAKSALYKWAKVFEGQILAKKNRLTHSAVDYDAAQWTDQPTGHADAQATRAELDAYRMRLLEMVGKIRAMGAQAILVTQARGDSRLLDGRWIGLDEGENQANGLDRLDELLDFNAVALDVCSETGALCIDLGGQLIFGPGDFYDRVHNTPQGARKIGLYLHAKLKGLPLP